MTLGLRKISPQTASRPVQPLFRAGCCAQYTNNELIDEKISPLCSRCGLSTTRIHVAFASSQLSSELRRYAGTVFYFAMSLFTLKPNMQKVLSHLGEILLLSCSCDCLDSYPATRRNEKNKRITIKDAGKQYLPANEK